MKNDYFSVLIPDGESEFAILVLRSLSEIPNVKVNILSSEPWSMIRFSKHRARYLSHSAKEGSEEKLEAIKNAVRETKSDIVLPVDVPTIRLIAENRAKFASIAALPPTATPETIDLAVDKGRLTRLLMNHDIPAPATIFCEDGDLIDQDISRLTFPVLVKLTEGTGGRGIELCNNISELNTYLKSEAHPEKYIIQSFINGHDMDCSVLCKDGEILAYTMQKGIVPPYNRFAPPAGVDFFYDEQAYKIVQELMRVLNWSGVAHVDMRYDDAEKKPKILEINPRFWGSLIGSLVAGINFPYLACLISRDMKLPTLNYQHKRYIHHKAAVKFALQRFLPGHKGNLAIRGTGIQYVLADLLPEIAKYFRDHPLF